MEKNKTILTTAAVALATTIIGAGVANADNVQTTSSNNVQAKASDKVTNADLNSAKQNVSSAKASVSSAQANVNSAQNKVNVDKQNIADASLKIPEIQSSIKKQESAINNDQTTITHDKQNINSLEKNVDTAKQNVSSAQANVNDKQSAVSSAQNNVNKDQQRINDIHNAQSIAFSMKNKVANDKQVVADKQNNQANAQRAADQASSAKANADQKVSEAQNNLTNAQNKENQDQKIVNGFNDQLTDINDQIGNQPTVNLPQGYVNLVNQIQTTDANSEAYKQLSKELLQLGAKALNSNTYVSGKTDENEILNTDHITYDQAKALTVFTAQLINQVRAQFGTAPVRVTNNSIKFAMDCANQYVKDNWDPLAWHDEAGLGKVEDQWGINSGSDHKQYYEDAGTMPFYGPVGNNTYYSDGKPKQDFLLPKNMNDAKSQIYNVIMEMLFKDDVCGWLHAGSLGGVEFGQRDTESPYLGVSLEPGQYHFEIVPQNEILSNSQFMKNSQAITVPDTSELMKQKKIFKIN